MASLFFLVNRDSSIFSGITSPLTGRSHPHTQPPSFFHFCHPLSGLLPCPSGDLANILAGERLLFQQR